VPGGESDRKLPGAEFSAEEIDAHTLRWATTLNDSGDVFVTPSMLDGRWMVRLSIGAEATQRSHVERLWRLVQEHAANSAQSTN
jgi:aromatic-L-amino-acid/L-tryptophan decarboxylase